VAEVDGFAFHATREPLENDRSRDLALASAGVHVVRVTWTRLVGEPEVVLAQLAQALGARSVR
jgi:very-short-patch-repair endonuclease